LVLLGAVEAFADTAGERDDPLPLVAVERLLPGGDRFVAAASGLEHAGKVAVRVGLKLWRVALRGFCRVL
jgi:hypothetical protein